MFKIDVFQDCFCVDKCHFNIMYLREWNGNENCPYLLSFYLIINFLSFVFPPYFAIIEIVFEQKGIYNMRNGFYQKITCF